MLNKHRRLLVLALILFLVAGGVDVYVLYAQVIPQLLVEQEGDKTDMARVPVSKEALPKNSRSLQKSAPVSVSVKMPDEDDAPAALGASPDSETLTRAGGEAASQIGVSGSGRPTTPSGSKTEMAETVAASSNSDITEDNSNAAESSERSAVKAVAKAKSLPGFEPLRFGPNKTLLWKFEKKVLRDVASTVNKYANVTVLLTGHADGAEKDPMALSRARADAAKSYLIDEGVDASKIATEGLGNSKPLTKKTAEKERKRNRRVRVRLVIKDEL